MFAAAQAAQKSNLLPFDVKGKFAAAQAAQKCSCCAHRNE